MIVCVCSLLLVNSSGILPRTPQSRTGVTSVGGFKVQGSCMHACVHTCTCIGEMSYLQLLGPFTVRATHFHMACSTVRYVYDRATVHDLGVQSTICVVW